MRHFSERLQKIRVSQDTAAWYRLLSSDQIRGLLKLPTAIRDDLDRSDTQRVRKCITDLGIVEPMVGKKNLQKLIKCCRGSDLAFLYFLLIGFYRSDKSDKSNVYTYNEQVLMSAIMELDLEMTLYALDQILPLGHLSPRDELRLAKKNEEKLFQEQRCDHSKKINNTLPYFWRQPRPKPYVKSIPGTSVRPDVVVSFPFWPVGEDATYKLDENRWFANYKLQPVKRLAHNMITDIINDFCYKCFPHDHLKDDNKINLCNTHRNVLELQQTMKDELTVKAFQRWLELFDCSARENKLRRERIIAQLDQDVENYTEKLRKLDRIQFTNAGFIKDCKLCKYDKEITTFAQKSKIKCLFGEDDVGHMDSTSAVYNITSTNTIGKCKSFDSNKEIKEKVSTSPLQLNRPLEKTFQNRKSCLCPPILNTAFIRKRKSCKRKFFTAFRMHQPYIFNYQRTFDPCTRSVKSIRVIRREAVRALTEDGEDSFVMNASEPGNCERTSSCLEFNRDQVIKAIVKCAETMWCNSVTSYEQNQTGSDPKPILRNGEKQYTGNCLQYKKTYFDPDDSQLMDRMLRDGLNVLRCDPNFVLASFPDAHKTIVMREWIKRRYGKTYNDKDLSASLKNSDRIFHSILMLHNREPPCFNIQPYLARGLTYADGAKMFKMASKTKTKYYKELNDKVMRNTTLCWMGMGGEFRKGSYLKDMFYSYLPARKIDITCVHPWRMEAKRVKKIN